MPLTTTSTGNLAAPSSADDECIYLTPGLQADLCEHIATPGHAILTIYTARQNEQVLAYACETVGGIVRVKVQRGFNGTTPVAWSLDSCVCTTSVLPGAVCPGTGTGDDCCAHPLDGVHAEGCIEIDCTDRAAPVIRLVPSGVVPGDYCGIRVNACGLIEEIDPGWPASCLPVFNPCTNCCGEGTGGGGGQSLTAAAIGYVPRTGATYALAADTQSALDQLDSALTAVAASAVTTVTGGAGVTLTGSTTNVTVSHQPGALSPGAYSGFVLDALGHIVGFTPPPAAIPQTHFGVGGVSSVYNAGMDQYTHSLLPATSATYGGVTLATGSDVITNATGPGVITLGTIQQAVQQHAPTITAGAGLTYGGGVIDLQLYSLPQSVVTQETDTFVLVSGPSHATVSKGDLSRDIGVYASGHFKTVLGVVTSSRNVATITVIAVGHYRVTLDAAQPLVFPTNYSVQVTLENNPGLWASTFAILGSTQFDIMVYDNTGAPFNPADLRFHCMAVD